MPWEVSIPEAERDPALPRKLEEELPGILAWLVFGALEWQRVGLAPPAEVNAETEEYRAEQDVLAGFIADKCVEGPECTVKSDPLYVAYKEWCDLNGERQEPQNKFSIRLRERGYEKKRKKSGVVWLGIGLGRRGDPTPDTPPDVDPTPPKLGIGKPNTTDRETEGVGCDPQIRLSARASYANIETNGKPPTTPYTPTPGVVGNEESLHDWIGAWESA